MRLLLVRHGEPETAWGAGPKDPGLSVSGRAQAAAAAARLRPFGPLRAVSSPMRRCRETAEPYEQLCGAALIVEPRVSEVRAPAEIGDRRAWLAENFPWRGGAPPRSWATLAPELHAWRAEVLAAVLAVGGDCVAFTHFIAINAIVAAALRRDETIVCRPDFASVTELDVTNQRLRLLRLGAEMQAGEVH